MRHVVRGTVRARSAGRALTPALWDQYTQILEGETHTTTETNTSRHTNHRTHTRHSQGLPRRHASRPHREPPPPQASRSLKHPPPRQAPDRPQRPGGRSGAPNQAAPREAQVRPQVRAFLGLCLPCQNPSGHTHTQHNKVKVFTLASLVSCGSILPSQVLPRVSGEHHCALACSRLQ